MLTFSNSGPDIFAPTSFRDGLEAAHARPINRLNWRVADLILLNAAKLQLSILQVGNVPRLETNPEFGKEIGTGNGSSYT